MYLSDWVYRVTYILSSGCDEVSVVLAIALVSVTDYIYDIEGRYCMYDTGRTIEVVCVAIGTTSCSVLPPSNQVRSTCCPLSTLGTLMERLWRKRC